MRGLPALVASLQYGSGLRLLEALLLRTKDLDFDRQLIVIRDAKGSRQRVALLPDALRPGLRRQLARVQARQAGVTKRTTTHTLRHSFATRLLKSGTDIRTIQTLLGHKDVRTTMVYTHVVKLGPYRVRSPLDQATDSLPP